MVLLTCTAANYTKQLSFFRYFAQSCTDYQWRGWVGIFHTDSGYSIRECRIRLKQGDEISHDTIIQLYLLWPYPDDRKCLLRIYTHQKTPNLFYGMNMIVKGKIFFAVRLTEANQTYPGVCSYSFCSTNLYPSMSPRAVCMRTGVKTTQKHAQMFPCYYSPILWRNQISDYLQMHCLEIPLSSQLLKAKGETNSKTGMEFSKAKDKPVVLTINQQW